MFKRRKSQNEVNIEVNMDIFKVTATREIRAMVVNGDRNTMIAYARIAVSAIENNYDKVDVVRALNTANLPNDDYSVQIVWTSVQSYYQGCRIS